jgi:hypothetical protein
MSVLTDFIRKLTGVFTKNENSDVGKMVLLLSEQIDLLNDTFTKIEAWRDIDAAEGTTLDLIGSNVGQQRGKTNDDLLRILIKARIARNSSDGTFNNVINALTRSINADPSKIKIRALYDEGEPGALIIEGIPLGEINKAGMTALQFGYIAEQIVAAGLKISSIDLTGSFSFSSQNGMIETDPFAGFATLDQSTGGALGGTIDPNETPELPI